MPLCGLYRTNTGGENVQHIIEPVAHSTGHTDESHPDIDTIIEPVAHSTGHTDEFHPDTDTIAELAGFVHHS